MLVGGVGYLRGLLAELADARCERGGVSRRDGRGDGRVEAQPADRIDENVAMGVEIRDQRFDGRVNLVRPPGRQGRAGFSNAVELTSHAILLALSRLQDLGALLRRLRPLADRTHVHFV